MCSSFTLTAIRRLCRVPSPILGSRCCWAQATGDGSRPYYLSSTRGGQSQALLEPAAESSLLSRGSLTVTDALAMPLPHVPRRPDVNRSRRTLSLIHISEPT